MSKKRELPEYVYEIPKRSGRYYFQRFEGSKRHRMRAALYSGEFWSIYAAWVKAYADLSRGQEASLPGMFVPCSTAGEPKPPALAIPQTWRWLCQEYFRSTTYQDLAKRCAPGRGVGASYR